MMNIYYVEFNNLLPITSTDFGFKHNFDFIVYVKERKCASHMKGIVTIYVWSFCFNESEATIQLT